MKNRVKVNTEVYTTAFITSFLQKSDGISIVFFSTRFQRARGCNYGIPRLSQNKMKTLVFVILVFEVLDLRS